MSKTEVKIGSILPTKDIGSDSRSLLRFAPNAENIGLDFVVAYDHVVGVNDQIHDLSGALTSCPFNSGTNIHEPMVVFGAMAAMSKRIKLITGCLVSPQRPTALVAKQAAELDILSNGRFELGVSIGWNEVEFSALGANFRNRANRLEDQVHLLRQLWSGADVVADIAGEKFDHVNIRPLPTRQTIPIWIGGLANRAIERAAKIADGWLPLGYIDDSMIDRIEHYWLVRKELSGRQDGQIMGRINPWNVSFSDAYKDYLEWAMAGATHIAIGSSQGVYESGDQYFDDLERFKAYLDSKKSKKIVSIPNRALDMTNGPVEFKGDLLSDSEGQLEYVGDPLVCVVTGTHSSGKSTLLSDFEDGKLVDLGVFDAEYDDFGYGVIEDPGTGMQLVVITVPEAARWMAELHGRPDLLAENYNLNFQLSIDAQSIFRTHAAKNLANAVMSRLIENGRIDEKDALQPVILCDRSPLDGVIYSEARIAEDTNRIGTFPRTGALREWLRTFVDLVVVADSEEVAFEVDEARLHDGELRRAIASSIDANYRNFMAPEQVFALSGDETQRKNKLVSIIFKQVHKTKVPTRPLPYEEWGSVCLVT